MIVKKIVLPILAIFLLNSARAQLKVETADAILQAASQKAAKEKKNVFVIFHASWCGWCHKIDTAMNDQACRKFFDDNYVICHLTVFENQENKALNNPGALEFLTKHGGEKSGLPFWLILDENGKLLSDSQKRPDSVLLTAPGENIGYPGLDSEIEFFKKVLRATSKLTPQQLEIIGQRFRELKRG